MTSSALAPTVFDPSAPPPPSSGGSGARYVYLLSRLRNRQITMEEATELFSIQQSMIRSAQTPPPPPPTGAAPPPSARTAAGVSVLGEDADWVMFLGLGLGAGLAAAMVKRMTGGAPGRPAASKGSP